MAGMLDLPLQGSAQSLAELLAADRKQRDALILAQPEHTGFLVSQLAVELPKLVPQSPPEPGFQFVEAL